MIRTTADRYTYHLKRDVPIRTERTRKVDVPNYAFPTNAHTRTSMNIKNQSETNEHPQRFIEKLTHLIIFEILRRDKAPLAFQSHDLVARSSELMSNAFWKG